MDTDRSDEGQFSTPRAGARQAGYSSASDNEGDGGQGYSSARSWTSDNEYGTPRNSGNLVRSDSEVDGFYSGRDNGCNDIFITGILDYNPQVIQSTDLSIFSAIKVTMEESSSLNDSHTSLNVESYPHPLIEPILKETYGIIV